MCTEKPALVRAPYWLLLWQRSALPVVFDSVSDNSTVLAPSAHSQSYMPKKGPSAPLLSNGSCPRRPDSTENVHSLVGTINRIVP